MEVHMTSKQMIKPSSSTHLLKPFKISLLDQLSPRHYSSLVLFYSNPGDAQFSDKLKQSLSKALTQFYPVSGRLKNNLFITDYDAGVPYVETRVKCRLSDFIERTRALQEMNQLLPCRPFSYVQDSTAPQLAVQANVFDCGGIAMGFCALHNIFDGAATYAFLSCWTAYSRGSDGALPIQGLLEASSRLFPPIESMPESSGVKNLFFNDGRRKTTRSFVFDASAIATLMFKTESKRLGHPSRVLALTAFLWKHAIMASRSVSGSLKSYFLYQPVNLRPRMNPQLPEYSIGNLVMLLFSAYNPVGKDIDLSELGYLLKQSVKTVPNDPQDVLQGLETAEEQLRQLAEMVSKGNADVLILSSWLNTFDGAVDFGWGKPNLISIPGVDSHNREVCNLIFLKNAMQHDAIEVWFTLSDKEMSFLEQDPEFLAFASPSPYFDKTKI